MWPVACGFVSPSQSSRLTYLAQQALDQPVPVLLQVKIRSEIQVNGGSCNPKTDRHDTVTEPGQTAATAAQLRLPRKALGTLQYICATGLAGLRRGGSTALPEQCCPKKPLAPSLVFLLTGFDERLLVSTIFWREAFPGKLSPMCPCRTLCMYLVLGLQGCDSATLPWLWGEGGDWGTPALPIPLHCSH